MRRRYSFSGFWAVFFLLVFCENIWAKPILIRLSNQLPPAQSVSRGMELFKRLVEERTGGNVKVEVYHSSQLYSDKEIFPALQSGSIEAGLIITGQIAGTDPLFSLFDQPFLVANYQVAIQACKGKVGETLSQHLEKLGIKGLCWPQQGFMQVGNVKHSIRTPKDFRGLKLRVATGGEVRIIQLLGGAAVVIPAGDAYTALARGTVDGVTTSIASFHSRKWSEVAKYLTIYNITHIGFPLCINKKFWDTIPKELQKIVSVAAMEAEAAATKGNVEGDEKQIKIFKEKGVTVTFLTDEQLKEFREKVKPVREEFLKRTGSDGKMLVDYIESIPK